MKTLLIVTALLFSSLIHAYPVGLKGNGVSSSYPALIDLSFLKLTKSGATTSLTSLGAALGDSLSLGGTKAASAILDVQSTTQGVLSPRMTTAQMNAISSPAAGLTVYNTDFKSLASYDGAVWTYGFGNLNVSSEWLPYTPSIGTAFGTVSPTTNQCQWKRIGGNMLIKCSFAVGTPAAGTMHISLPSGYSMDSTRLIRQNTTSSPGDKVGLSQADANASNLAALVTAPATSLTNIYHAGNTAGANNLTPGTTLVGLYAAGAIFSFEEISIPILGWTSNTAAWVQANSNPIATTTVFSAQADSTGAVAGENLEFITGNCTNANPSVCTLSGFTAAPNCIVTSRTASVFCSSTTTSNSISFQCSTDSGVLYNSSSGKVISCQRSGADYTAAHSPFIIAPLASYNSTPGITSPKLFSAKISSGGVVSDEVGDFINGNCSTTSPYTCTWNSGLFTRVNCACAETGAASVSCRPEASTNTSGVFRTITGAPGTINDSLMIICHGE